MAWWSFRKLWALLEAAAGVDWKRNARDVPSLVGGKEEHRVADVFRCHPGDRQKLEALTNRGHIIWPRIFQIGPEHAVRLLVEQQWRVHVSRMHGVGPDGLRAEFDGEGPHQPDHSMFGPHIVAGIRVCLQPSDRTGQDDRAT